MSDTTNNVGNVTKTLFELLLEKVQGEGVQQAAAFEVTLADGTSFVLRSQADSRLEQQVDPATVQVKVLQTAAAGGLTVDR